MLFNFIKKSFSHNAGGLVAYYNLTDWWLNELSESERKTIIEVFTPLSTSPTKNHFDKGENISCSQTKINFLSSLASLFHTPEYLNIGKKILKEGERYINESTNILDVHFFYSSGIKLLVPTIEKDSDTLNIVIDYCKKQISISKEAKKAFLKEYPNCPLPGHSGYYQLAEIYESQNEYSKALNVTKQAFLEGWNYYSQKDIDRLEKKISKSNIK